jgi:hypothetical protein
MKENKAGICAKGMAKLQSFLDIELIIIMISAQCD